MALRGRAEHENGLIIPGFGGSSPSLSTSYFTSWPDLLEHLTGRSSPLLQCELPLFSAGYGPSIERIAILKAGYPAVWGVLQTVTGPLSDRVRCGRCIGHEGGVEI